MRQTVCLDRLIAMSAVVLGSPLRVFLAARRASCCKFGAYNSSLVRRPRASRNFSGMNNPSRNRGFVVGTAWFARG